STRPPKSLRLRGHIPDDEVLASAPCGSARDADALRSIAGRIRDDDHVFVVDELDARASGAIVMDAVSAEGSLDSAVAVDSRFGSIRDEVVGDDEMGEAVRVV